VSVHSAVVSVLFFREALVGCIPNSALCPALIGGLGVAIAACLFAGGVPFPTSVLFHRFDLAFLSRWNRSVLLGIWVVGPKRGFYGLAVAWHSREWLAPRHGSFQPGHVFVGHLLPARPHEREPPVWPPWPLDRGVLASISCLLDRNRPTRATLFSGTSSPNIFRKWEFRHSSSPPTIRSRRPGSLVGSDAAGALPALPPLAKYGRRPALVHVFP